MRVIEVDVAIVGAGTAGLAAYRAAKAAGASVVTIDGGEYGTTRARGGCMPSKLLIAAAEMAHGGVRVPGFGVRIDGRQIMERLRRERDRFVGFLLSGVNAMPEWSRLRGHARFVDDRTLQVDDHTRVCGKSIVIATGSRAAHLDDLAALGDRLVINDDVFGWQDLPASLAVLGPGVIGLELGQALHRLGLRVAVLGRGGRIGPITDPLIRDYAIAAFNEEFTLEPAARMEPPVRDGEGVAILHTGSDGVVRQDHFDYLLAATGRAPDLHDTGLGQTTLKLDARGAPLFDPATTQAVGNDGASPIFVAGDAGNPIPLLHEAVDEGRIAGQNAASHALGKPVCPGLRRVPLSIVFTDPQIAVVGGGLRALQPGSFAIGKAHFEEQGCTRTLRRNKGLLNVYGDLASGRFLGAEMLVPEAEHLAHLFAWALQKRMMVADMLEMPFYRPVIEEGVRTALRDLRRQMGGRSF